MTKTPVGKVLALFVSHKNVPNRVPKESLELDSLGIIDNKFYDKEVQRSVLLASKESYDLAKAHNINIDYGLLGENIVMDFNPYSMNPGEKLIIGSCILEISQHCTLCKGLSAVNSKLPKLLKEDRGIFSKVVQDGQISLNDTIYILK